MKNKVRSKSNYKMNDNKKKSENQTQGFLELEIESSAKNVPIKNLVSGHAGFIERIRTQAEKTFVEGWSICLAGKNIELPKNIYVVNEMKIIGAAAFNVERPDVLAEYNVTSPLLCGFRFSLPASIVESEYMIEILVEDSYGKIYQLVRLERCGLQLELTGRCNLRCPMCPSVSYSKFHNRDLSIDDLELIKPLFRKIDNMCFDGFGEALLAKNFDTYIKAVPRLKELIFHTNGLLLDQKLEIVFENSPPLRSVIVSIDSLIPEIYKKIRRGSNLKKVLNNIERFILAREKRGNHFPRLIPNITIMKINYKEIENFIYLASELDGILELNYIYDPVQLDERIKNDDKWKFNYEKEKPKNIASDINKCISESLKLAERLGVTIQFSGSHSGILQETVDKYGYAGVRKPLNECQYMKPYYMLQADGRFQFCVWQTSPVFDWKKTRNADPMKDIRGKAVWDMIMKGTIPFECSGSGCMWVGRRKSKEIIEKKALSVVGGWSGKKYDKNKIKKNA